MTFLSVDAVVQRLVTCPYGKVASFYGELAGIQGRFSLLRESFAAEIPDAFEDALLTLNAYQYECQRLIDCASPLEEEVVVAAVNDVTVQLLSRVLQAKELGFGRHEKFDAARPALSDWAARLSLALGETPL